MSQLLKGDGPVSKMNTERKGQEVANSARTGGFFLVNRQRVLEICFRLLYWTPGKLYLLSQRYRICKVVVKFGD